ncbi:SDR family NAD(P)-dependent oxidoreductase [Phycisphaerales bacterium AB-hyl4]|uniref:SDR family NAD(P)-dependent oxidoreductase n=1 Tax=Natronomicrosphaera hydrolytica TaxID=3242702 RepID=A0ABV4U8V0_9BACT
MAEPLQVFNQSCFAGRAYGVTGGSRGIGRAVVQGLLDCGASVMTLARDSATLERLEASLPDEQRARLLWRAADVSYADVLREAVDAAGEKFGRMDGWVSNAMCNPGQSLADHDESSFEQAWQVNTLAAWRAAKLLQPHFERVGGGALVHVSSVMAQQTVPNQTAYTSSKAALEGLTRALAVELATLRVRVNTVVAGFVLTYSGMPDRESWTERERLAAEVVEEVNYHSHPWPGAGMPEDAAATVLFLLSDAARFVTGTTLVVDGGMTVDLRLLADTRRVAAAQRIGQLQQKQEEFGDE